VLGQLAQHIGGKEGKYMSQENNINDGYEENPWDDENGENLRIIEDFLPSPASFAKSKAYIFSDEKEFTAEDLKIIERMAAECNIIPAALMAGVLHNFVVKSTSKRQE
jgi:hypothetical protein